MSAVDKYLAYRGEIRGIVGIGDRLAFVTVHPEGRAAGLYRLDVDKLTLESEPLPKGGTALVADASDLWIAGGDSKVYRASIAGGAPKPVGLPLERPAEALALLADGRVAALVGATVQVLSKEDGKAIQTLELPEAGTCLAADPSGRWLAAGTAKGTVAVFDAEDRPEFAPSASSRLHEGAVTAILFEADDLRFFSAGLDQKLLSTHARGRLEPEDKGKANNHADAVPALIWGPGDRLLSGSRDGSIKSWPRAGGVKPSSMKDGVARVVALTMCTVHDRPRLVAACDDGTIRIFPVDPSGKVGDLSHRIHDASAGVKEELRHDDPVRREAALKVAAGFDDAQGVEILAGQAGSDADHALRKLAAEWLAASDHPRAATLLEKLLAHRDEAVRVAAFQGLRRLRGPSDLGPIDLALKAETPDVGKLAVEALRNLATKDDQALARLHAAIDSKTPEVRLAALVALESAFDPTSPEPNLVALASKHADARRAALVRLRRRGLLEDPSVRSALRRRAEDADPEVRRVAFLLALHARPRLLQALRARDPELERQVAELESAAEGATPAPAPPPSKEKESKKVKGKTAPEALDGLDDLDREPLLNATASRSIDTCLRGARGLAVLGDPRAFGLLLQLSREDAKAARAEVCRAMAALDDPRAVERLRSMIHDDEAEVRDAAFTALARIHQADPLLAAESGLNASHEDVRRRGLQALVAEARKAPKDPAALELLARALNDSVPAVRAEAFKSALGLQAGGAGAGTLRFAARSIHADVRREALTEACAQVGEPWGWDVVLEFFNDPDPGLRGEAFAFALKKTKGLEFLDAALGSRYPDLRLKAVEGLVKKHTAAAQSLLARALEDEDKSVRLAALATLVDAGALPALAKALDNPHPDVRLRAAKVFARHGDPKALAPLVALATAPEPDEKERQPEWLKLAESALDGLGELGDPSAVPTLIPPLDSPHAAIRKQAAHALARACPPDAPDPLRQALRHADPEVKYNAALGLALLGDASMGPLIFSDAAGAVITRGLQIAAALALGPAGEERLVVYLDDPRDQVRSRAFLVLMMTEWKAPKATPSRVLAGLASRPPRLRLASARALEALAGLGSFPGFVAGLVNDRGDKPPWKVAEATVDDLAEMLVRGGARLRARSAALLRLLDGDEQAPFDQAWAVHKARFANELADLRKLAPARKPVATEATPDQLRDLAFGAYVGLIREPAPAKGQGGTDPSAIKVRQSALAHLQTLAEGDPRHARAALPVFVQALGDPNQAVRFQAFDQARALGMPAATLAAEALASGHVDLGVRGLELLAGGSSEAEGRLVLERAMLTRKDDLAVEAARLLVARVGTVAVASPALDAAHEPLRRQAVSWLSAEADKDPKAKDALRKALGSRFAAVREAAALELASKKDPAAFEALLPILKSADPKVQGRAIAAIEALGDPRGPDALLDRVADDPAGTALADWLIQAVGRSRRPESAPRLLALLDDPKRRDGTFAALLLISGYDQPILDPDDRRPPGIEAREREQHPRSDALLATLLDRLSAPSDARYLARLIPGAGWAKGREVDAPLGALANHPDDATRHAVVRALGERLRNRSGDAEPLRRALGHRDPTTQFLAAEGLGLAGRPDGLNVLLASIDFNPDLAMRRRAVLALGELGDDRAAETLLKLAGEDGHALQEPAAEAIGHLGRSPRSAEVSRLLERMARGDGGVAESALKGLRWLNTAAGWALVRQKAADARCPFRALAVELLGHNDDPATRDLLLKLLATLDEMDDDALEVALASSRKLWPADSLEPDYALLQNPEGTGSPVDDFDAILGRVRDRGEPARIFAILPKCPPDVRDALRGCLLDREQPPVAEAKTALDSPDPTAAGIAARILGRAKAEAAGPALEAALGRWRTTWDERRPTFSWDDEDDDEDEVQDGADSGWTTTCCLWALVWACGRLGVAAGPVAEVAGARPDDRLFRPIRREAVLALAAGKPTADGLRALESAATGGDPEIRAVAAQALGRLDPARSAPLAERLLADAVGFRRLELGGSAPPEATLRSAARQVHYQGVVLPDLVARGDVEALAGVAGDRSLPEGARLGALEGLAATRNDAAEAVLRAIGSDAKDDEDVRKAAWRALRRSKRAREKSRPKSGPTNARAEVKS